MSSRSIALFIIGIALLTVVSGIFSAKYVIAQESVITRIDNKTMVHTVDGLQDVESLDLSGNPESVYNHHTALYRVYTTSINITRATNNATANPTPKALPSTMGCGEHCTPAQFDAMAKP